MYLPKKNNQKRLIGFLIFLLVCLYFVLPSTIPYFLICWIPGVSFIGYLSIVFWPFLLILISSYVFFYFNYKKYVNELRGCFEGSPQLISEHLTLNENLRSAGLFKKLGSEYGKEFNDNSNLSNVSNWTLRAFLYAHSDLGLKKKFILLKSQTLSGANVFVVENYCVITKDFSTSFDPVFQTIFFYIALFGEKNSFFKFAKYFMHFFSKLKIRNSYFKIIFSPVIFVFEMVMKNYLSEKEFKTLKYYENNVPEIIRDVYPFESDSYADCFKTIKNGEIVTEFNLGKVFYEKVSEEMGFNNSLLKFSWLKYYSPVLRHDSNNVKVPTSLAPKTFNEEVEDDISELEAPLGVYPKGTIPQIVECGGKENISDDFSHGQKEEILPSDLEASKVLAKELMAGYDIEKEGSLRNQLEEGWQSMLEFVRFKKKAWATN